ncbi:glycoside hydrolase family 3 protein [Streptosporangiaceae bacterium NEAU-GS5]|nr:glycoside hydrolase family 3 protein [Streptosporangiaceae bacterium NEAU-GS5]
MRLRAVLMVFVLSACTAQASDPGSAGRSSPPAPLPYLDAKLAVADRVRDLLGRMTLDEKIGQMTQATRNAISNPADITTYGLGSLLSGGGEAPADNTAVGWADMIDGYQRMALRTRLRIPMLYGADAVHGHNNVPGATIFPHNVGLGATRDPALAERIGRATGEEAVATGVRWDFSPCLCVSRDERWGRAYESFGEDPALVSSFTTIIDGLQEGGVIATAKHFVGDGGTAYGSSRNPRFVIDQGNTPASDIAAIHLPPYESAVKRHVGAIMASFSSIDGEKMHADKDLITGMLKDRLGFDGFVVSDWAAIDWLPGNRASDVRTSIDAGLDMIMVPRDYPQFIKALRGEVDAGRVPMSRIDDAVSRILTAKFRLGLFEHPFADRSRLAQFGSPAHRALARTAAAKSQVLLKNDGGLLPLSRSSRIYVAGSNADDLGHQMGGWSISWQGGSGPTTTGTTILAGIKSYASQVTYSKDASAPMAGYDVGVVVVGETPYAEGLGDVGVDGRTLELSAADRAAVDKVCGAMKCAVLVVSGRPLIIDPPKMTALVAAWLPGSEGTGVADPLFGAVPYGGKLPVTWPRSMKQIPINVGDPSYDPLYAFGFGLTT